MNIEKIGKTIKKKNTTTTKIRQINNQYFDNLRKRLSDVGLLYDNVSELLTIVLSEEESYHIDLWKNIDTIHEIKNPDIEGEFLKETQDLCVVLDRNLNSDNSNHNEIRFLQDLRQLLINFQSSDINMPGTGKNINEFLEVLKDEINAKKDIVDKIDNVNKCKKYLQTILEKIIEGYKDKIEFDKIKDEGRKFNEEEDKEILK